MVVMLRPVRVIVVLCALLLMAAGAYAQTTQESGVRDTAALDTLTSAAQAVQGQSQMQPPAATQPTAAQALDAARDAAEVSWTGRLISFVGIFVMLLIGWAFSYDRKNVPWRIIGWGIGLQLIFALIILKTAVGAAFFDGINHVVVALLGFTVEGARFLFGDLVFNNVPVGSGAAGSNAPMTEGVGQVARTGAFFAFNVLPTIIFFSSLMTVMYYLGVMQKIVKGVAWVMMRTMKTSGAETLSAAGNIFLGQTEAPLLIKPFIKTMTRSELMAVMTGGFATVAGGVMAAYVGMLLHVFPDIAGHLMAASVMSAPAALVFAKLMLPEREEPVTRGSLKVDVENPDANVIDAAARGAGEGLHLALNVGAMLLAFIALIAVVNSLIGWTSSLLTLTDFLQARGILAAGESLSLQTILGWIFAPLAWLMGVPWKDAPEIGALLGIKTAVNEFVGYLQLSTMVTTENLSPRSVIIATYALCGFANFSSIAIQIGGISGLAPERRGDLAKIGFRAMIAGTLASFMTANIAGMLV
jgi:concentrative nucleoside transporter, CNT family